MAQKIDSLPSDDNFYLVPEFLQHQGCWMVWPERTDNWRLGAKPAQLKTAEIANILIEYENITVIVSKKQFQNARKQLNPKIRIIEMSTNDCFIRDYGPFFLQNPKTKTIRGLKCGFNAFGGHLSGVYFPWDYDDMVAQKIFELEKIDYYELPMVLEPSMIIVDGKGTCFASAQGILCDDRNPYLSQTQIENYLKNYLNVVQIIWIPFGFPYDETKGRLDNIMTLINETTILLSWTDNINDERYLSIKAAADVLNKVTNAHNQKFKIIKIDLPPITERNATEIAMLDFNNNHNQRILEEKLINSYVNLYLTNGAVLVPTFNDPISQKNVLGVLNNQLLNRRIIMIDAWELSLAKSGIHNIICYQPLFSDFTS